MGACAKTGNGATDEASITNAGSVATKAEKGGVDITDAATVESGEVLANPSTEGTLAAA